MIRFSTPVSSIPQTRSEPGEETRLPNRAARRRISISSLTAIYLRQAGSQAAIRSGGKPRQIALCQATIMGAVIGSHLWYFTHSACIPGLQKCTTPTLLICNRNIGLISDFERLDHG